MLPVQLCDCRRGEVRFDLMLSKPSGRKRARNSLPATQNKFAEAVGCRKIIQEVDDGQRTIRECAYSGGDANGVKRTGNKGIRIFYYQCSGEGCNGSTAVVGSVRDCVADLLCSAAPSVDCWRWLLVHRLVLIRLLSVSVLIVNAY